MSSKDILYPYKGAASKNTQREWHLVAEMQEHFASMLNDSAMTNWEILTPDSMNPGKTQQASPKVNSAVQFEQRKPHITP